jgi:hypothetical protein
MDKTICSAPLTVPSDDDVPFADERHRYLRYCEESGATTRCRKGRLFMLRSEPKEMTRSLAHFGGGNITLAATYQTDARQGYANLTQPSNQRRRFARHLVFKDNLAASMTHMHDSAKDKSIPA